MVPAAFGWTEMLAFIEVRSSLLGDAGAIQSGYQSLREALGEAVFSGDRTGPLAQYLSNAVPGNLRESSTLGQQLVGLRAECRSRIFDGLRRRLLSADHDTVLGVLAELHVLLTLRQRHVPVRLLETRSHRRSADLTIDGNPPTDIEVSYLGLGSAWRLAEELRGRLEVLLTPLARDNHLFVQVRCAGFAGELLRHVPRAIEKFGHRVRDLLPWDAELVPGLTFSVLHCSPGWVIVSGATIRSANPFANESLLVRLPAKMAEEALQVRPGGIVFIRTSELSSALTQVRDAGFDLVGDLVRRIEEVGSRARNVSAFAVLDEMGTDLVDSIPPVAAPATFSQAVKDETRQRLLWVPNLHAEPEPKDLWKTWFELPF